MDQYLYGKELVFIMKTRLNEPRRHHYVPRIYLQNFAIQEKNEWQIIVIDKTKKEPYITNIKNVAVEKDFYRIDNKEDEFYWEHYYAEQVEPLVSTTFSKLITIATLSVNNSCVLNDEIKSKLAKIMCSQLLRTKKSRNMQFEIGIKIANEVIEKTRKQFEEILSIEQFKYLDDFVYDDILSKSINLPIINEVDRMDRFADLLLKRYWVMYKNINYKRYPLITSDHPVVYYNIITGETDTSVNGLGVPQTTIYFPINRELVIGLYTQDMYFNTMIEMNNKMIILDDNSFIMKLNRIQYEQCYRQAYFT